MRGTVDARKGKAIAPKRGRRLLFFWGGRDFPEVGRVHCTTQEWGLEWGEGPEAKERGVLSWRAADVPCTTLLAI